MFKHPELAIFWLSQNVCNFSLFMHYIMKKNARYGFQQEFHISHSDTNNRTKKVYIIIQNKIVI